MCELARVSRASYYRDWERAAPADADMELRSQIQRICVRHRWNYGYRRVTDELRLSRVINRKKVQRLMRLDNLLAVRKRKFVTTDSKHALAVFPNLAPYIEPDGPNQLWVADITYIRLRREFVFFAVVLDVYSRRVVGWALDRKMQVGLVLRALEQALEQRKPQPGLVHHSDRGVQYASDAYVGKLMDHGIVGSMSRPAYPYDNAFCERFMRTLKEEEVYCSKYSTIEELQQNLKYFIEEYYNQERLHSALGYQPPAKFEREFLKASGNLSRCENNGVGGAEGSSRSSE
jgi:putative transposase